MIISELFNKKMNDKNAMVFEQAYDGLLVMCYCSHSFVYPQRMKIEVWIQSLINSQTKPQFNIMTQYELEIILNLRIIDDDGNTMYTKTIIIYKQFKYFDKREVVIFAQYQLEPSYVQYLSEHQSYKIQINSTLQIDDIEKHNI